MNSNRRSNSPSLEQPGSSIRSRLSGLAGRFRLVVRTWELIWAAAGSWTLSWLALTVADGLIPAGLVQVTRWLVDTIAGEIGRGLNETSIYGVFMPAAVMGGLLLLQRTLKSIIEWVSVVQSERVQDHAKLLIHEKAGQVEYGFYERPELLDMLNQANGAVTSSTLAIMQGSGALLSGVVSMVAIMALVAQYGWWLPLVLVFGAIPSFLVLVRQNRRYHAWWRQSTQERRIAQYFDTALTIPESAAEIRMNFLSGFFSQRYQEVRRKLRNERSRLVLLQAVGRFGAALLGLLLTASMMGWIVLQALTGKATLGDLALFYQAFTQGQAIVGAVVQSVGAILMHTLFLQYFFDLIDRSPAQMEPERPAPFPTGIHRGIQFRDVHFAYPSTDREALRGFNLDIPAGKIVAIVGENGAGKSTLTKLLCRFYDPQEGSIEIDGQDVRTFDLQALRRHISLMPQWPVRYFLSVDFNIRAGDMARPYSRAEVERAAEAAEARSFIERLPGSFDTQLGRIFEGGVELSGGQWQRLALARAFFRQAPIIVLDEPTSYMDSWSEIRWMSSLRNLVQDKTTLLITHRFTTAMQADLICVLQDGQVIESGTHSELVEANGHYAASWRTQMQAAGLHSDGGGILEKEPAPDINLVTEVK